jgi:hypothetical protein
MLYFSNYVDKNARQLRQAFIHHKDKMNLEIRTSHANDEDWEEFFDKVITTIREKTVEGVTEHLECNFSTTDKFSLVMSTAIIMNTFKKYFTYTRMGDACGIVNIHMGGTLDDWEKLEKKLAYLKQFDMDGKLKRYVDRLQPVLEQFTETYKGHVHLEFWNNIYNERVNPEKFAYEPLS